MNEKNQFIAHARREVGLSQYDFSEILGVSAQSVSHWEAGKRDPSRNAIEMCDALLSLNRAFNDLSDTTWKEILINDGLGDAVEYLVSRAKWGAFQKINKKSSEAA